MGINYRDLVGWSKNVVCEIDANGKKNVNFPKGWNSIKKKGTIKKKDTLRAYHTGKINDFYVIDIDPVEEDPENKCYKKFIETYPELKETYTEKSRKAGGFHIFIKYKEGFEGKVKIFKDYEGTGSDIDILGDNRCAISAPTKLKKPDNTEVHYQVFIDEPVKEASDKLFKDFEKQLNKKYKLIIKPTSNSNINPVDAVDAVNPVEAVSAVNAENKEWHKDIVRIISVDDLEDYDIWFKVVCSIKAHGKDNPLFNKEFAHEISAMGDNPKYQGDFKNGERDPNLDNIWEEQTYGSFGYLVNLARSTDKKKVDDIYTKNKRYEAVTGTLDEMTIAEYFLEMYGNTLVMGVDRDFYTCNNKTMIWNVCSKKDDTKVGIANNIYTYLRPHFKNSLENTKNEIDEIDKDAGRYRMNDEDVPPRLEAKLKQLFPIKNAYEEVLKKMGTPSYLRKVADGVVILLEGRMEEYINFNNNPDIIHFENGVLMLDKLHTEDFKKYFRNRRYDDYSTYKLPYSYTDKINDDKLDYWIKWSNCLNNEKKDHEFLMDLLAYSLTGYTTEQIFTLNIGYKASNGKSALFNGVLKEVFGEYVQKCESNLFSLNNNTTHKQLDTITKNPTRIAFVEELASKQIDWQIFKDLVDGGSVTFNEMFATTINRQINCGFFAMTNVDMDVTGADQGVVRRIVTKKWENVFYKKGKNGNFINAEGDDTGIKYDDSNAGKIHKMYPQDITMFDKCRDVQYKLAFIKMLFPYWIKYYKNDKRLNIDETAKKEFSKNMADVDEKKDFIKTYVQKSSGHRISKEDILERLNNYTTDKKNVDFKVLNNLMKQMGHDTYSSQKRGGINNTRGVWLDRILLDDVDDIEDEDDNLTEKSKMQQVDIDYVEPEPDMI